jgi:hypothetical protein
MRSTHSTPARHTDSGQTLAAFVDEFLVSCPGCNRCAIVRPHAPLANEVASDNSGQDRTFRLLCSSCGRVRERVLTSHDWGQKCLELVLGFTNYVPSPLEPAFGCQLWLVTQVRSHSLWFLNMQHLEEVARYIAATHRVRHACVNVSMVSRLPRWMISARARKDVLAAIARLRLR